VEVADASPNVPVCGLIRPFCSGVEKPPVLRHAILQQPDNGLSLRPRRYASVDFNHALGAAMKWKIDLGDH
jgi:hypothetical protein